MNKLYLLLLLTAVGFASCKKSGCTKNFLGNWSGNGTIDGNCTNGQVSIEIRPADNECEVMFPGLPEQCWNGISNYQVLGKVEGDSIFISEQPYRLTTVSAHGILYLNQLVMEINRADGFHAVISVTK